LTEFWHFQNVVESLTILKVFTPLYKGVRESLWIANTSNKKVVWSFDQSTMIFCLIWLLSYEGSISNPLQVCRNIVAGVAVILVL